MKNKWSCSKFGNNNDMALLVGQFYDFLKRQQLCSDVINTRHKQHPLLKHGCGHEIAYFSERNISLWSKKCNRQPCCSRRYYYNGHWFYAVSNFNMLKISWESLTFVLTLTPDLASHGLPMTLKVLKLCGLLNFTYPGFSKPLTLGQFRTQFRTCLSDKIVINSHQLISLFSRYRGHGTYLDEEKLTASVAGEVERVNKLICVRPLKTR